MREWEASFASDLEEKERGLGEVRWGEVISQLGRNFKLGSYVEVMIENWRFAVIIEGRVKVCIVALKLIYSIFNLNEIKKIFTYIYAYVYID